jgi:cytochrome b561
MLQNTETSYGLIAKILHAIGAVIFLSLIIVGFYMTSLSPSDDKWALYGLHKSFGIVAIIFVCIRFYFKLKSIKPALPENLPNWQKIAANGNVHALYTFMFIMPISGIIMSLFGGYDIGVFGIFTIKAFEKKELLSTIGWYAHTLIPYIFCLFIALHIGAALYHHFILKDNILRRMFF